MLLKVIMHKRVDETTRSSVGVATVRILSWKSCRVLEDRGITVSECEGLLARAPALYRIGRRRAGRCIYLGSGRCVRRRPASARLVKFETSRSCCGVLLWALGLAAGSGGVMASRACGCGSKKAHEPKEESNRAQQKNGATTERSRSLPTPSVAYLFSKAAA